MPADSTTSEDRFIEDVVRWSNVLYFYYSAGSAQFILPEEPVRSESPQTSQLDPSAVSTAMKEAQQIVSDISLKQRICSALKSATKDLTDIAKTVAAVLLPLSLSGAVAISLSPIVYAGVALIIFTSGVAAFCAGISS
jgi:hypothetical protein